jgi:hypothetical protein
LFAWSLLGFGLLFAALGGPWIQSGQALAWNAVRMFAPAAVGSAFLLALVLWAHPLSLLQLQNDLMRILTRGCLVSLPGYLMAALLMLVAGAWQSHVFANLTPRLVGLGLVSTAFDVALIVVLARRFLPKLQLLRVSLPAKLVIVLTVTVPLRVTLALIVASFMPS